MDMSPTHTCQDDEDSEDYGMAFKIKVTFRIIFRIFFNFVMINDETFEDDEVKQRKFKEDMMLLNLRLHRAIEPDDINYVQLSANGYPQGVHWERNIKNRGRERAEQDAFIRYNTCLLFL